MWLYHPQEKKSKYDSEPGVWSGATDSDAALVVKPVDLERFFPIIPTPKSDSETPKEAIVRRANEDVMDLQQIHIHNNRQNSFSHNGDIPLSELFECVNLVGRSLSCVFRSSVMLSEFF